jgi:hypothetical protein
MESGGIQLKSKQILPIYSTPHRISAFSVGEIFHELQNGHQSQLGWTRHWLPYRGNASENC